MDFTLNVWTVAVTVIGWLAAGAVIIWKLGAWTETVNQLKQALEDLRERFHEHDKQDEKRFESLADQVHKVAIDQARLQGGKASR